MEPRRVVDLLERCNGCLHRGDFERGCQRPSRGDDGRVVWSFTSKWVDGKKVLVFRQGLVNRADETKTCLEGWS